MNELIQKIVAIMCITVVAAIMAFREEPDYAIGIMLVGLVIVFVPWDKIIELFRL